MLSETSPYYIYKVLPVFYMENMEKSSQHNGMNNIIY